MPRKLKPYKVDAVAVPGKGKVEMFLDRDLNVFFGMVGPTRIQAQSAEECRSKLYNGLKNFEGLKWIRYIEVSGGGGDHHLSWEGHRATAAHVTVQFRRFEGARTLDKRWVQRPFPEDLHPDSPFHGDSKVWYVSDEKHKVGAVEDPTKVEEGLIPYSDEAWATLQELHNALDTIGTRIEKMVEGPDLARQLQSGSHRLLAPAE